MNTCFGYAYYLNNFINTSKKKNEYIDMYKMMYVCMYAYSCLYNRYFAELPLAAFILFVFIF